MVLKVCEKLVNLELKGLYKRCRSYFRSDKNDATTMLFPSSFFQDICRTRRKFQRPGRNSYSTFLGLTGYIYIYFFVFEKKSYFFICLFFCTSARGGWGERNSERKSQGLQKYRIQCCSCKIKSNLYQHHARRFALNFSLRLDHTITQTELQVGSTGTSLNRFSASGMHPPA